MSLLEKEKSHEILHYKEYYKIKNIIKNNYPNIILNGITKSGKTFLINHIMEDLFGSTKETIDDKLVYKENLNYFVFDFSNHVKNNIIKKINLIIKSYDHFNETIKYIVIDNYNDVSDILQKNIKVFIEKYHTTSRFIFITKRPFSIDASTRNSCTNIKLKYPNKYDKYIYFSYLLKKCGIKYNEFLLLKYCEKYHIDHINKIYYNDGGFKNIYEKVNDEINSIINKRFNIEDIKKISMKIKELSLDLPSIFSYFIKNNKYSQSKQILLIKEISHYNYIIKKSYRDIIPIEGLLVKIYYIINHG
tara:strand:+ start:1260 stop:2171 length:912 start_codon:yes stop_codon:yes gene_type:complete